ncbi:MAG: HDOD domain-containing protein [Methylococcaceae bacterium]
MKWLVRSLSQHFVGLAQLYAFPFRHYIETKNGCGYKIESSSFKACYPLSSDTQHQCTAIAKSSVSIIHFQQKALQQGSTNPRNSLLNEDDIPENLRDNLFFKKLYKHFKQNELVIPSLPDVALKLRTAVQKDIGIRDTAKIVSLDPVISSKLIQIVNGPLYRTVNPITSCHDAITRLGLITTKNLVTSIGMQNIFRSNNINLNHRLHQIWKQSVRVSSISHTLATLTKKVNPDEALLAGLTYNIGSLSVIIFANSMNSDEYSDHDIDLTLSAVQGLLGNIILNKWDFPDTLTNIPRQTENWYHDAGEKLDLSDIVLLAKFHSYLGNEQMQNMPPLYTLPAFKKLGDNTLTPDMSLQTLHDAKQQISDAISLFNV